MIVYGDPQFTARAATLLDEVTAEATTAGSNIDRWRLALIKAGQLEQGVADADGESTRQHIKAVEVITDAIAQQFVRAYLDTDADDSGTPEIARLCGIASAALGGCDLRVKVPEGFAFYSLYPEQYVTAAGEWMKRHAAAQKGVVAVIGIRSIGTSLSAAVAERLRREGWTATRCTVRPHGHPFERRVELPTGMPWNASFAMVVDEGPGLSGSSMAAVAEALSTQGFTPAQITFLPAHGKEPGGAASDNVRRWWSGVERIVVDAHEICWHGKDLLQSLRERSEQVFGAPVLRIEDASGGVWRRFAYRSETEWPVANIPFERAKYICTLRDGRRVLWKFGTGEDAVDDCSDTSVVRVPIADQFRGFTAQRWIEGHRLTVNSAPTMVPLIGDYIRRAAAPPLKRSEAVQAAERLADMLYWNTLETLGEEFAGRARDLAERARLEVCDHEMPRYGDGRMAPHEFVLGDDRVVYKTDHSGHDMDHTTVGRQNVLWDVAGTMVDWELSAPGAAELLSASGTEPSTLVLSFYCAAYCAFRLGMLAMIQDRSEQRRADGERHRYSCLLKHTLGLTPTAGDNSYACANGYSSSG